MIDDILKELELQDTNIYSLLGLETPAEKLAEFDFDEMVELYYDKPAEFAYDFLGFEADAKQREIMESVRDNKRTSVRSGQGVGKTATVACIIIWFICTRFNARIMATAPSINQLFTVLWAEIAKWLDGSFLTNYLTYTKTRLYMNGHEAKWFAFPKTATSKEGIAGQHEDNLLVIADEASGIKDDILETLLGTISGPDNKLLFISNPTRRSGIYFDAFHRNRAMFNCIHIDAEECPRVDRENIEMLAKSYGKDSNVYKVRVKGNFPDQEDDVFISLTLVEDSVNRDMDTNDVYKIELGVDVARFGDDETVIAKKIGAVISPLVVRHGQDTMQTTGDILRICYELREQYPDYKGYITVKIDDTGVGGGVTDRLREIKLLEGLGWLYIVPVNFSAGVRDRHHYDITTFMWAQVREQMIKEEVKLPDDPDMIGQFSCRKYMVASNGKIRLESKKEMKKRGIKSPDRADAVALACLPVNIKGTERPKGGRACQT